MIRRRGPDAWQVVVYAGVDTVTGRERYVRRTVHAPATRGGRPPREARDLERRLELELADGKRTATALTLGEVCEQWLEHKKPSIARKTAYNDRWYFEHHIRPAIGSVPLAKLTTRRLDAFYDELRTKTTRLDKPMSPTSITHVHSIVRRTLDQAVRWGWIPANPADRCTLPSRRRFKPDVPEVDDVVRLLNLVGDTDLDFAMFLWLAAVVNARRSELMALRWEAVDLGDEPSVLVSVALTPIEDLELKDTKTGAQRRIGLDPLTAALLQAHADRAGELAQRLGVTGLEYLFPGKDPRRPLHPDTATQRYRRYADKAKVPGRLHDLRHFGVTELLRAGADVKAVQQHAGHASGVMTLDVYGHARPAGAENTTILAGLLRPREA